MSLLPWKKSQQQKQLSAYLDGELTSDEQLLVEEALRDDPQSQQLLEDLAVQDDGRRYGITPLVHAGEAPRLCAAVGWGFQGFQRQHVRGLG